MGYQIAGFDSKHNFLIGRDGSPYPSLQPYRDFGALRNCQIAFERALYHFYRGECEAAAYYMGCMVHLISDVSCFPHVLPVIYAPTIKIEDHNIGITLYDIHRTYEPKISNQLTDHPYWWPPVYFDTNLHGWTHQIMDPSLALEGCARDTFIGDEGHGAEWMYENVARACIWSDSTWTFPAFDIRYDPKFGELFRCIERDINTGIFYSAAAVQFIYDECLGSITCDCDQNAKKEGIYKIPYEYEIIRLMHEMSFLVGFSLIGKISAVVAQVIAEKKLEELAIPTIKI